MDDSSYTLGQRIRRLREAVPEYRKSQQALADAVGVERKAISNWENDKTTPGPENLAALSRALGVSQVEILTGEAPYAGGPVDEGPIDVPGMVRAALAGESKTDLLLAILPRVFTYSAGLALRGSDASRHTLVIANALIEVLAAVSAEEHVAVDASALQDANSRMSEELRRMMTAAEVVDRVRGAEPATVGEGSGEIEDGERKASDAQRRRQLAADTRAQPDEELPKTSKAGGQ